MDSRLGSHKAQDGRLLRPKPPSNSRHSTESAPPAFENGTPHSHPRVAFSESEELQADSDRRTGKGRADSPERRHQALTEYAINKLRASEPRATSYTPPARVMHLEPPPSMQRRLQNHPRPTPPTKAQHLQDPSTSQAKPTATPHRRERTHSRNRRQPRHRHKPRHERHEPFVPLDPYRVTISPIAPAISFFKHMGDWAMRGLPNREGRAPQGADHELEAGLRLQPRLTEASIRAETEQLQEQMRGRRIPRRIGNLSDGAPHFPAPSTSLPNLPEIHLPQHNPSLYPPGHASFNLEEGAPSRPPTPEKAISRPSSKASRKGDSAGMEMNGEGNPALDHSPPKAVTSPKPASEPAPHHTPLFSRISPLHLPSQIPGFSHPDNTKPNIPLPGYWKELVRQIYRYLLLRLPSLYFNRVGRVFQEARMSKPDLELLISRATATHAIVVAGAIALGVGGGNIPTAQGGEEGRRWVSDVLDGITGTPRRSFGTPRHPSEREGFFDGNAGNSWGTPEFGPSPSPKFTPLGLHGAEASQATLADAVPPGEQWTVPHVPWSLERFKAEWENFVIGLIKEWKTLNILSALLLTALITVLQIQDAVESVVTRTVAMLSLISALMSLIFGCVYILRFSTMRTMRKAAKWAEEAQKSTSDIFWNVWVFLALPACWLAWSVIFFCVTVVCMIWTTGTSPDLASPNPGGDLSPTSAAILGPRVVETSFFVVGLIYFVMVIRTFWVWSSIGVIPLRAGEGEHSDGHHSKEGDVAAFAYALPARSVPGGTGKALGIVLETKEGEGSQYADEDEKPRGRSPGKKATDHIEVVVSKGETGWEKGRGRWWGKFSSKDNLAEGAEKTAYVDALDLEPGRIGEGSRERDVHLRSAGTNSTPGSVLGVSLHG